jgi:hypothetical protein
MHHDVKIARESHTILFVSNAAVISAISILDAQRLPWLANPSTSSFGHRVALPLQSVYRMCGWVGGWVGGCIQEE